MTADRRKRKPPVRDGWDYHQGDTEHDRPFGFVDGWFVAWTLDHDGKLSYRLDLDEFAVEPDDERAEEITSDGSGGYVCCRPQVMLQYIR